MLRKLPAAAVVLTFATLIVLPAAPAQFTPGGGPAAQPQPQPPPAGDDGPEVLARGPVHEAYAATVEQPGPGEVAPNPPPEPVEELPPDQKPEGENVQWIPGYWDWDEERADFIWVSGFWRVPPPGRVWVPGSWREVNGGFQWTHGFWQPVAPPAQPNAPPVAQEIEYLPQPPAPLDIGPAVPAPEPASVYVPGCWVWRTRYVWRPGFWMPHRPGWVWTPACYRWTPVGCVFVDGYWDYPLATRGVLFTPVFFPRPLLRPAFVYTPTYVVAPPVLYGALFCRRGYGNYYFGDYYEPRYATVGFRPWCAPLLARPGLNINIGIGGGRRWAYDPLWSYYSVAYRDTPRWSAGVGDVFAGRYRGDIPRPPRTLVQQNTAITNITNVTNVTNVTNNITVVNNNVNTTVNNPPPVAPSIRVADKDVTNVVMVAPLKAAPSLQPQAQIQPIAAEARQQEARAAREVRQVAVQRRQAETEALAARPPAPKGDPAVPGKGNDPKVDPKGGPAAPAQPVRLKLDVPKQAVARAQVRDEKAAPPPPPTQPKVDPKADPKTAPPVDGRTPLPKLDPKAADPKGPRPDPKLPKVDPKGPVIDPKMKVDPKTPPPLPKADPKGAPGTVPPPLPKGEPKADPKLPPPAPKGDPKLPPPNPKDGPPVMKVDPKPTPGLPKVDPKGAPFPPKGDPKNPGVVPPPLPKTDPKTPAPLPPGTPKVDPKLPAPMPKGLPPAGPPQPKADPKLPPAPQPKSDPKTPPAPPQPKAEPKPPAPTPKGPPAPPPKSPMPPPKGGEPKSPPPKQPAPPPKNDPPAPPKKDPPQALARPLPQAQPPAARPPAPAA
ncbi:MAG: hypothetical protein K2X82_09095, partial [Gemmataceae bacterium]|nr:hypothetical protein [Gemmataceae bacterium]